MSKRKFSASCIGQSGLKVGDFYLIDDVLRQLVVHMNQMEYGPGRHFWIERAISGQSHNVPSLLVMGID